MAYVRQVPQNIMTVELKIFDFMTLKQFGISVALVIISFLIYFIFSAFSPWNIIIPAVILIVGGIVLFVPFNGEPFQEFVSNYLESMVSPQRRLWHKKGIILKTAADKARIYQYGADAIGSVPLGQNMSLVQNNDMQTQEQSMLDQAEKEFLKAEVKIEESPTSSQHNSYTPPTNKSPTNANVMMNSNSTNAVQENRANISQKTLFNSVKISNNNPNNNNNSNNASQTVSPGNTMIQAPQKSTHEFIDDAAVKNYIFGSVEDYEDKPIENALVYLKNPNDLNTIEFIYTNEAGEFKTNYEYPKGHYVLQVVYNDAEFNTITIEHTPIDPQPIYIHPSDYDQYKLQQSQKNTEVSNEVKKLAEDGVFTGNYDASLFSFGSDYDESLNSYNVSNVQQTPPSTTNNDAYNNEPDDVQHNVQHITTRQEKPNTARTSVYNYNTNNLFEEFNSQRIVNDYKDISSNASNAPHTLNQQQNIRYFDFNAMPNINLAIDPSLLNVPNTLNGIIVGPNKQGIAGIVIQVFDKNGHLVTSTITDHNGIFHSFSSLPNGDYVMYLSKNNQLLVAFNLKTSGSKIPPKIIQFV